MPPGGTSHIGSHRLNQACGWLQYSADTTDSNAQSSPPGMGNESRGPEALTSSLVLPGFKREIPRSQEEAHCLEKKPDALTS